MELFTIQMGKRFEAQKRKLRVVDTTVKSSDRLFAPTWAMVMEHKAAVAEHEAGRMTDEELKAVNDAYTAAYRRMMIQSWVKSRDRWEEILKSDEPIAISCYCQAGKFCHRLLLKDIFEELCKKLEIPFEYFGELT